MSYFDIVLGHESIKKHFTDLLTHQRLPHSLLFYGEEGLGKLKMAMALASALLERPVFAPIDGQSYLTQMAKKRIDAGESAKKVGEEGLPVYIDGGDAFWLRPVKASLKVEQWYTLLQNYLQGASGSRRVVIVEDFHTANAVMANAMLKTIEEPPADTYFIIITAKRATVLPTIVSRCMAVPFLPIPDTLLQEALRQQGYTDEALREVIPLSKGNPALAHDLLEKGELPRLAMAMKILETVATDSLYFAKLSLESETIGREEAAEVLQWVRTLVRDMLALRYGAPEHLLRCPLYKDRLAGLLPSWRTVALLKVGSLTMEAEEALRLYVKSTLVMDGVYVALHRTVQGG